MTSRLSSQALSFYVLLTFGPADLRSPRCNVRVFGFLSRLSGEDDLYMDARFDVIMVTIGNWKNNC